MFLQTAWRGPRAWSYQPLPPKATVKHLGLSYPMYLLVLHVQEGHVQSQSCAAVLRVCGHTRNRTGFFSFTLQVSLTSEEQQIQDPISDLAHWWSDFTAASCKKTPKPLSGKSGGPKDCQHGPNAKNWVKGLTKR